MPPSTIEWSIEIELSSGRKFKEGFATEQEVDTRINQMKGQNWVTVGNYSLNPNQIALIRKRDLRPPTE